MKSSYLNRPILLILALAVILGMLRLGFWQLDRAEQKRLILHQTKDRSTQPVVELDALLGDFGDGYRFRKIQTTGHYLGGETIYLDNQTHNSRVGYHVVSPFQLEDSDNVVMVNRGWVAVGNSRQQLPKVTTPEGPVSISGRLNLAVAQPPLWDDQYPVSSGSVWQYLPLDEYAAQMQLKVLSLVVELAPGQAGSNDLEQQWAVIDDQWVAKHQGYAFQWFAMALALFIASLLLLIKSLNQTRQTQGS